MADVIPGLSGRLIGSAYATEVLPDDSGIREAPPDFTRAVVHWNAVREARLGPASSIRAIADIAAIPLLELLGYRVSQRIDLIDRSDLMVSSGRESLPVAIVCWSSTLDGRWREVVTRGIASDSRWSLCTNGRELRIVDSKRTWTRQFVEFDLAVAAHVPETRRLLWTIARAHSLAGNDRFFDRSVELSARHGTNVCRALADGVIEALRIVVSALGGMEQSLTVLYRVLFLLFAEARGLVPIWHPLYRDRYTIDGIITRLMAGGRYPGIWPALQAIARLAHAGCRAGDLRVTAFNGRLFSPLHTPAAERRRIDDRTIGTALLAVGTTPNGRAGRARIRYGDLDVEQLGAVYEHVLDYEAVRSDNEIVMRRTGDARKATGTFYTPRSVTGCLVRRALAPLVRDRTADEILTLRVVDPAMGSGAFLVAACRYLAAAAEAARLRDGEWQADEATPEARVSLRRDVAQRCLFGVDLNPMAVQLARLSLWLTTLAGDRPLTFLDHRLAVGDSMTGASLADVLSRPPGRSRGRRSSTLPLFDAEVLGNAVRSMVDVRLRLALERDDEVQIVRRKEIALAALKAEGTTFRRWKAILDLWCAGWFAEVTPSRGVFHALSDALLRGRSDLPGRVVREWQERTAAVAEQRRFLHWEAEFPEVFFDARGQRAPDGGFDAVIGNPPWDMVRGDSGAGPTREGRRADARHLIDFVRGSGIYAADARSHVNRYQLFVERALQITRPGGRIGLALPSGLMCDAGSAPLRRRLLDGADVDMVIGLGNRAGIFPIHRSVRFVLMTATTGRPTDRISCRFGVSDPAALDSLDEHVRGAPEFPVTLSRAFLARVSGEDDLAMPELVTEMDLRIVEKISAAHPRLSSSNGWHARFGRELNASDDRDAFVAATGATGARPVLEGKQIAPFRVDLERSSFELRSSTEFARRIPRRARLAYRDVASATNRLTLIAAIVPARAVTTHTLFCLRTPLSYERQLVLCGLMNSFVANYLVRLRVTTHVTIAITSRMPLPVVRDDDPLAPHIANLVRDLTTGRQPLEEMPQYSELQAIAARMYGLSREEFEHILTTFPLIPITVREAALASFKALQSL